MTKADLKVLAQLPSVLAVLRKLADEAKELHELASALSLSPAPAAKPTHENGWQHPASFAPPPRVMSGLAERLPDFSPKPPRSAARAALDQKLEEVRHDPSRGQKLAQFARDDGDAEEMES